MANHLIIGLGGTGGNILKAFQKRFKARYGDGNPENTRVNYLYVDSSEADLNASPFTVDQKVNIHGMKGDILAHLNEYPSMKAFISDEDRTYLKEDDQVGMIIDTGIGGQRRRFGRMLIANNVMSDPLNGFSAILRDRIHYMSNNAQGPGVLTIHICAGLAGGTGSGSIIDAIAQLHKILGLMNGVFEVFLYLYVPEVLVPASHDAGYYHANGYAALREINALALKYYHPTDIGGEIDYNTGKVLRLLGGANDRAFKQAYLFSDRNQMNYTLPKGTLLPAAVGDFLFQRIVASEISVDPALSTRLDRVINSENNNGPAEQNAAGINARSRDFMSFGITRIVYPEAKIKIFSQEKSGAASLSGLMYNHWVNGLGYQSQSDEIAGAGVEAEINLPATQDRLRLTLEYLTLQKPVPGFEGADGWSGFTSYWDKLCTDFYNLILETQPDRHKWASDFDTYCSTEYMENFRSAGVDGFFTMYKKEKNVNGYAACLMKHIENLYFKEWISLKHHLDEDKPMSLQKVRLYISELKKFVERKSQQISQTKINAMGDAEQGFAEADKHRMRLENTGWVRNLLFEAAKQEFNQYKSWMAKYYWSQTLVEACDFATLLLEALGERLYQLEKTLQKLTKLFSVSNQVLMQKAASFGHNNVANEEVQVEVVQYNREAVVEIVEAKIVEHAETQTKITEDLLKAMRQMLTGDERPFQCLFESLGGQDEILTLDQVDEAVKTEMEKALTLTCRRFIQQTIQPDIDDRLTKIGQMDPPAQLFGVNILDKLKQDYPSDDAMRAFFAEQINRTMCFLQTNPAELAKGTNMLNESIQICIPKHPNRDHFIQLFRQACGGAIFNDTDSIAFNPESNEIVIIRVVSNLLIRYSQNLSYMKQKYDNLVNPNNPKHKLNKVLLHTETLSDQVMPDLFHEGTEWLRKSMLRTAILIHSVENLLKQGVDPETGNPIQSIQIGDLFAGGKIHTVGKDVEITLQKLVDNFEFRNAIVPFIDQFVKTNYKSEREKELLRQRIQNMIETVILPKVNNNVMDTLFQQYVNAAQDIFKTL